MREIPATITSKGQVTIPAEVRRHLGLRKHDRIAFVIEPGGDVRVKVPCYPTLESLAGAAGSLPQPRPLEEVIAEAREERLAKKYPPAR
jgi:antitoxin PrlF